MHNTQSDYDYKDANQQVVNYKRNSKPQPFPLFFKTMSEQSFHFYSKGFITVINFGFPFIIIFIAIGFKTSPFLSNVIIPEAP